VARVGAGEAHECFGEKGGVFFVEFHVFIGVELQDCFMGNHDRALDDLLSGFDTCLSLLHLQELSGDVRLVGDVCKCESHNFDANQNTPFLQKFLHLVHDEVTVLKERRLCRIAVLIPELTTDSLRDLLSLCLHVTCQVVHIESCVNRVRDYIGYQSANIHRGSSRVRNSGCRHIDSDDLLSNNAFATAKRSPRDSRCVNDLENFAEHHDDVRLHGVNHEEAETSTDSNRQEDDHKQDVPEV